jgi:F-type H+-transporting ATPase subunit a
MASSSIDALSQFRLTTGLGPLGAAVGFTNSNEMMLLAVILIAMFFAMALRSGAVVPGRLQASAEMTYEVIRNMCDETMGPQGRKFFPLVFLLFSFILVGNLLGLVPYFFPFTSHLAITAALAIFVFVLSTAVGFWTHGFGYLRLFVPEGAPIWLLPFLIPIELLSYFSRPLSHSVRLFANITAGHVLWEVIAGFMFMLSAGLGTFGFIAAIVPLGMNVAFAGLEVFVALIQAYVFAILTCIYLKDAIHLH